MTLQPHLRTFLEGKGGIIMERDRSSRTAVTFLWVAVPYRSVLALGNRGYRSASIETGHICQGCAQRPDAMA